MTDAEALGALAGAVCAVMSEVGFVRKGGENDFHHYKYARDIDLLQALQPAMAEHGLALIPSKAVVVTAEVAETKRGARQWRSDVTVSYMLYHTGGAAVPVEMVGSGIDGEDKGVFKALTGAYKYVLRQLFAVPTGDDAERDDVRKELHRPPPTDSERQAWVVAVKDVLGDDLTAEVCEWTESLGRPPPSAMDDAGRARLLDYLRSDAGRQKFNAWLDTEVAE